MRQKGGHHQQAEPTCVHVCGGGGAISSKAWRNGPEEPQLSSNLHLDKERTFLPGTYRLSPGVGGPLPILPRFEFQKSQSALGGTVHRPGVGTDPEPPSKSWLFLTECENPVLQSIPSMYTILTFYKNIHSCLSNGKRLS